jgi:hypothetical protein
VDDCVMVLDQVSGNGWHLWHADCVDVMRGIPEGSVHYSIFSPPFQSLYVFSDDPRDVSNNTDDGTFWEHFGFVIDGLRRITMAGRLVSVHCMQLPTSKLRDGFIGLRDFRGEIIAAFQRAGFIYHSEVCIRKDPVSAMQRTKSIGLLHKQVTKDSTMSRMAVADYVVTMRKPGDNPEPVKGLIEKYYGDDATDEQFTRRTRSEFHAGGSRSVAEHKSISVWQRYAEPIWLDIAQSDTLSRIAARAEEDERHISPLQLTVIRRCIDLWTNPGDAVFSPFAGIGSAGYVAIEMRRRFVGVELKRSYYEQAVANLKSAEMRLNDGTLFSGLADGTAA